MDRDPRGHHYDPHVTHLGRGESYRPGRGGAAPPYRLGPTRERPTRDKWSSDRRDSDRREEIDSYVPLNSRRSERPLSRSPPGYRRRSRSPPYRGRDDTYPGRPRSPRRFSPRREERLRSPPPRRSHSPYGIRPLSSPFKRSREHSPPYSRRSSPPAKRDRPSPDGRPADRAGSPIRRRYAPPPRDVNRGGYRHRSRTPPRRDDRGRVHDDDKWKPRSPSSRPAPSVPASGTTSRRSSPPLHPDRIGLAGSRPRSPAHSPRPYGSRPQPSAPTPASPPQRERAQPAPRSPPRKYVDRTRAPSSPRREHRTEEPRPPIQPPSGPGSYRNGNQHRPPPSGPARSHMEGAGPSPPTGPSNASASMSAHNRLNPSILAAPTRPRGTPPGRFDATPRDFPVPSPRRGVYGGPPSRSGSYDVRDGPHHAPRGGFARGTRGRGDLGLSRGDSSYGRSEPAYSRGDNGYPAQRPSFGREDGPPPFRVHGNNSSSTTYPRTQRFTAVSQHLSGGEKIVPGGKLAPSGVPVEQEKRVRQLEEAAEKIREEIEEKQKSKREALRGWDVRQRESEREGLRSELAELHLEKLTDGDDGAGAAF